MIGKVLIIHGKRERLDKMANRIEGYEIPELIEVHCTDNDQTVEVQYISHHNNMIRTDLQGIPLNFNHLKRNIYVANFSGREFVMKL